MSGIVISKKTAISIEVGLGTLIMDLDYDDELRISYQNIIDELTRKRRLSEGCGIL